VNHGECSINASSELPTRYCIVLAIANMMPIVSRQGSRSAYFHDMYRRTWLEKPKL